MVSTGKLGSLRIYTYIVCMAVELPGNRLMIATDNLVVVVRLTMGKSQQLSESMERGKKGAYLVPHYIARAWGDVPEDPCPLTCLFCSCQFRY